MTAIVRNSFLFKKNHAAINHHAVINTSWSDKADNLLHLHFMSAEVNSMENYVEMTSVYDTSTID